MMIKQLYSAQTPLAQSVAHIKNDCLSHLRLRFIAFVAWVTVLAMANWGAARVWRKCEQETLCLPTSECCGLQFVLCGHIARNNWKMKQRVSNVVFTVCTIISISTTSRVASTVGSRKNRVRQWFCASLLAK